MALNTTKESIDTSVKFADSKPPIRISGDAEKPDEDLTGRAMKKRIKNPSIGLDSGQAPGYWARRINTRTWSKGVYDYATQGTLLNHMKQMQLLREPVLRTSRIWNGDRLDGMIRSKKVNIEAIHAQAVGTELDDEECCSSCNLGHGPFLTCVKVPNTSDKPQVCANCHFGGNGERCDLNKLQQPEKVGADEEEPGKSSTLNESNLSTTVKTHKDALGTQPPQATADSPIQTAQELPEGLLSLIIAHYELQIGSYDANIISLAKILNNLKIQRDLTARTLEVLKGAAAKGGAQGRTPRGEKRVM
ncbi:hypothetical protein N7519_006272 [Penicillium mononematosum]|uniref:uncharacterized protein n=1 Tax=Penicillium mononematosum TaxID=268346 RepID=UPI002546B31E|nr:uncharacterized protein N7519_006272 [Penicillium mononematosum]KAJ6184971.1 hypothetical protein N7519_006272 [Penicillium mononematosum]